MTDKNDALFLVRLPLGQKTIPYEEVPELIAMAKSSGYDGEHEAVKLGLDICHEEGLLKAAVQAGEVEVLDKSLHRMTHPFNGRLKDTVLTVQALREYVESIKGFLEVEDAPQTASADDDAEAPPTDDHGETLAALFDPLPVEALEKMFPANGKWKSWAERAKRNGLIDARVKTAMFNPYRAGMWFVYKGAKEYDIARLYRTLANNLPARSLDDKHLLTGGIN